VAGKSFGRGLSGTPIRLCVAERGTKTVVVGAGTVPTNLLAEQFDTFPPPPICAIMGHAKKNIETEPIAPQLVIAKQKQSAREFKEITKEMDEPRVAASVRKEDDEHNSTDHLGSKQ
jgi:hypothetical protein